MKLTDNDIIALSVLEKIENFRIRIEKGITQEGCVDWAIRMCEAIVADITQFKTRAEWVEQLKAKGELYG